MTFTARAFTAPAICECSRYQLAQVGCDCGAPVPFDYDAWDRAQYEAAEREFERREQAERDAEAAYWDRMMMIDAVWTYQAGF